MMYQYYHHSRLCAMANEPTFQWSGEGVGRQGVDHLSWWKTLPIVVLPAFFNNFWTCLPPLLDAPASQHQQQDQDKMQK